MSDTPKTYVPLPVNALERGEYSNTTWRLKVAETTPDRAITDEAYWSNNARYMNVFDIIQVTAVTGEWFAELLVLDKGDNWARMGVLRKIVFEAPVASEEIPSGYSIVWKGPVLRWLVIRDSDQRSINSKKLQNKADAVEWLQNHVRTMAA